jgi:hypothetical protein
MHKVRVLVKTKTPLSKAEVIRRFKENFLASITYHKQIGPIYIEGRDHGKTGRITTQCVLAVKSVETPHPGEIELAFATPQDANVVLSNLAAIGCALRGAEGIQIVKDLCHTELDQFQVV